MYGDCRVDRCVAVHSRPLAAAGRLRAGRRRGRAGAAGGASAARAFFVPRRALFFAVAMAYFPALCAGAAAAGVAFLSAAFAPV